jgi:hypothetical protein
MASKLVDLVKINVTSTGTGALTLGSAVEGYRGREVLTNGVSYGYSIQQDGRFEFGRGTYLASGNQLVRSPIDTSSGGAAINLTQNAEVAFVALSADLPDMATLIALLANTANGAVASVSASEAIVAGNFVNVYTAGGVTKVRKADESDPLKYANGFAPAAIASGATGVISAFGLNTAATPSTADEVWLGTAGAFTNAPPSTSGHLSQPLGLPVPGFGIFFIPQPRIIIP